MNVQLDNPLQQTGCASSSVQSVRSHRMRILIHVVSTAVFIIGSFSASAQITNSSTFHNEEQSVLAAEDEYVAAEVTRDEATLRRLVDDRFVFNSSKGTTTGKEELIQSVLKMAMVGQTLRERTVVIEGDIALIFGTADLRFEVPGKEDSVSSLRYTSTYVKRQGQWRMLALQMQKRDQ